MNYDSTMSVTEYIIWVVLGLIISGTTYKQVPYAVYIQIKNVQRMLKKNKFVRNENKLIRKTIVEEVYKLMYGGGTDKNTFTPPDVLSRRQLEKTGNGVFLYTFFMAILITIITTFRECPHIISLIMTPGMLKDAMFIILLALITPCVTQTILMLIMVSDE